MLAVAASSAPSERAFKELRCVLGNFTRNRLDPKKTAALIHLRTNWINEIKCDLLYRCFSLELNKLPILDLLSPSAMQSNKNMSAETLFQVLSFLNRPELDEEKQSNSPSIARFAMATSSCPFYLQIIKHAPNFNANKHFQVTNELTQEWLQYYFEQTVDRSYSINVLKRSLL
uniref:HAT C-terminal dimerisation domain-containing protein n=1 Tax=Ditylenchus dipsaci TaxID=166011 RepID=A0A915E0T6_9BILA